MNVSGEVRFDSPPGAVYAHFVRSVLAHAMEVTPDESMALSERVTVLTRYETKKWYGTIVTTEEASLEPGRSVTWRHVDGPLTGSVEAFLLSPLDSGTLVTYGGEIRARNRFLRGPLEWLWVGPATRGVSMASIQQARRELDGE